MRLVAPSIKSALDNFEKSLEMYEKGAADLFLMGVKII